MQVFGGILGFALVFAIIALLVFLSRWIFRINKIVENQQHQNHLLWRIVQSLEIEQRNTPNEIKNIEPNDKNTEFADLPLSKDDLDAK